MKLYFYILSLGRFGIAEEAGEITNLFFPNDTPPQNAEIYESPILKEASNQLKAYFNGKLKAFTLPLAPRGTEFMQTIWRYISKVSYGETASYKEIAISAGNPRAVRAVGMANNRNPVPIFIPCHRIIGNNGKLVGYRGGLEIKARLLELEKLNR